MSARVWPRGAAIKSQTDNSTISFFAPNQGALIGTLIPDLTPRRICEIERLCPLSFASLGFPLFSECDFHKNLALLAKASEDSLARSDPGRGFLISGF